MSEKIAVGWKEWVELPDLGIPAVKAKIDSGAKTSTLHASYIEEYLENGSAMVRFSIRPLRRRTSMIIECQAQITDKRIVRDSGGHEEERCVISTNISMAGKTWPIEVTLTNRDNMLFRMLLGRTAMIDGHLSIEPEKKYLLGKSLQSVYKKPGTTSKS